MSKTLTTKERFKVYLIENGLNIVEFCDRVGVSVTYLNLALARGKCAEWLAKNLYVATGGVLDLEHHPSRPVIHEKITNIKK